MSENSTPTPSAPWWQSVLSTVIGAVVTGVLGHFLGPGGAVAGAAVTTGVAHILPNPQSQSK